MQVQARLGQLRLPAEVCAAGAGAMAALAALRRHLMRLRADDELASSAHVVRPARSTTDLEAKRVTCR